jgi:hypothetical protein
MREAVTPSQRLSIMLRWLSTGNTFEDSKFSYKARLFLFCSCSFLLGVFAKLREATVSFVIYVRLSVRPSTWIISARSGGVYMKFDI